MPDPIVPTNSTESSAKPLLRVPKNRELRKAEVIVPTWAEQEQFDLSLALIPAKIKTYRLQRGLTQAQLAALAGIHVTQVSKLENKPVSLTLATILKVFYALQIRIQISFEPEAARE